MTSGSILEGLLMKEKFDRQNRVLEGIDGVRYGCSALDKKWHTREEFWMRI